MHPFHARTIGNGGFMIGLGTFLFAFLISYAGTVLLLRVRLRGSFVDVPNERSSHDVVKPRFGGIAIVTAFMLTFVVLLLIRPDASRFVPLLLGGALIFSVGLLDDWRSLPISVRLAAQLFAALILVVSGNVVDHIYLPLVGTMELDILAVPFTICFVLASINFYNFIDGIDGLAAGSAFIVSAFLALIAYMLGHTALALFCLAAAGSTVAFLQFNFPPSRLFMGDSGSTFLGFFFAFVAISGNRLNPEVPFFVTVLLLSSLYLDAGLTLLGRAFRGEKIFQPHHTHYYQRLLSLGLNHKQVTLLEYALTALLGVSALIYFKAGGFFPFFVTLCWLAIFTSLILKIRSLERGDRLFWERRTLLVIGSDVMLIALAYFAAYFIRMNFQFTEAEGPAVLKAFPIVLVVRSACFYWYGLYRGVWKYTSTPDVVRIIKAVTAGSVIILVFLVFFYRFIAFPRSLFIIEYFLLIIAVGGSRFASRLFHEIGKEATGGNAKRVAIVGAGDYGERLLREIRSTEGKSVSVVCFVDDDKEKDGLTLQGIPITGSVEQLGRVFERYAVDSVVLGITSLPDVKLKSILRAAAQAGVDVEWRESGYVAKTEPAALLFDRVAHGLGRDLPLEPTENVEAYYRDKRVLVTHGGEAIGPALVRELVRCGAEVAVHTSTQRETERFSALDRDRIEFYAGNLDRELDTGRVFEAANPQVVLHAVELRAENVTNEFEYVWRRTIRTCETLCRVLPRHGVEAVTFLFFWDNVPPAGRWRSLAAVCETLALNHADLLPAAPKAIRLPAVLTEVELRRVARGTNGLTGEPARLFGILETEAAALVLNATAVHKGRAILLPKTSRPFGIGEVAVLFNRGLTPTAPAAPSEGPDVTPLGFATESPKPSVVPSAVELVSPVYPASEALAQLVSECLSSPPNEMLDSGLETVGSELSGVAVGRLRTSVD